MEQCPDCGTGLSGGWTHRTREVIDLPQAPVAVTDGAVRWCMPMRRAGGRMDTTATSGPSAPPPNVTFCDGTGPRQWWMKRWARSLLVCWSATSTPPTITTTAPSNAAGPTCCGTSTTCGHSWRGGPMPSTMSTKRPKPSPTRQNTAGALPDWPWNAVCWPGAVPTLTTHQQSRPGCAAASRTTSRNSSSSWPNRRRQRTTTPPNAVCATW